MIAVNEALKDEPEAVNRDPYGAGWFADIEVSDAIQLEELLESAAYQELTS